jgi:hypothetical protein
MIYPLLFTLAVLIIIFKVDFKEAPVIKDPEYKAGEQEANV